MEFTFQLRLVHALVAPHIGDVEERRRQPTLRIAEPLLLVHQRRRLGAVELRVRHVRRRLPAEVRVALIAPVPQRRRHGRRRRRLQRVRLARARLLLLRRMPPLIDLGGDGGGRALALGHRLRGQTIDARVRGHIVGEALRDQRHPGGAADARAGRVDAALDGGARAHLAELGVIGDERVPRVDVVAAHVVDDRVQTVIDALVTGEGGSRLRRLAGRAVGRWRCRCFSGGDVDWVRCWRRRQLGRR